MTGETPRGPMLEDALALRGRRPGRLHMTLSFPIAHERIEELVCDGRAIYWNRELLARLAGATGYEDSRRLGQAIEPLFNDIADRRRGLFIQDFLLDTPSLPTQTLDDDAREDGQNLCDEIELAFPADVEWETEGDHFRLRLARPPVLRARVRAFWVAHSDTSLTWHLSLELPYGHDHAHYYALSLLQKAVFPTEGTQWLSEGAMGLQVRSTHALPGVAHSLPGYAAALFDLHARSLFDGIRAMLERHGVDACKLQDASLWERLLAGPARDAREPGQTGDVTPAELQCRALFLLEDPYFFELLKPGIRRAAATFEGLHEFEERPVGQADRRQREKREYAYDEAQLLAGDVPPAHLDYYFLAGFLQNIVDFLRQDVSELQDGTDPIYPPADVEDGDSHFLVYATQNTIYEIVSGSRSLEVGRGWIGTCPYLFLVHLMTLHNEALVRRYERMVRDLIRTLERHELLDAGGGLVPDRYSSRAADLAFEEFRRFRLDTFNRIAKHRYFNVLRYDTERMFYESIETVRGINQREEYWAKVVGDLEKTVDDLRGNESQKSERSINRVLFYVTFLGVLQVVFQLIDFARDPDRVRLEQAVLATAVAVAAMLVVLNLRGLLDFRRWWRRLRGHRRRRNSRLPPERSTD
jgi:hypothetical protein